MVEYAPIMKKIDKMEYVKGYHWSGRRLYDKFGNILVPDNLQDEVIKAVHERGHWGVNKTLELITRRYRIDDVQDRVKELVKECLVCQSCKVANTKKYGELTPLPIPNNVFESVGMDFVKMPMVTRDSESYDFILVVVCRLSKVTILIPCLESGLTSEKCGLLYLERVACQFGIPTQFVIDRDPRWTSGWWTTLCGMMGTKVSFSQAYRAEGNGVSKREIRQALENLTRKLVVEDVGTTWISWIPMVQWSMNEAVGPTGYSPYEIVFGRVPAGIGDESQLYLPKPVVEAEDWFQLRVEKLKQIRSEIGRIQMKQVEQYGRTHRPFPEYKVGDWVFLDQTSRKMRGKLVPKWLGPI